MEENFDKDDILGRWLGGTLSAAEEEALRKRPDFAEYERLVSGMEQFQPAPFQADDALAKLKAARKERAKEGAVAGAGQAKGARFRRFGWWAAAASVLLLLTLWILFPTGETTFLAKAGDHPEADLPDGSSIRLNAGSSLSFDNTSEARRARLSGEAFFEVAKDGRTFSVETDLGTVTVLGTSFNVYSRDDDMRVSCQTGKVGVIFDKSGAQYILTAGQSVSLTNPVVVTSPEITTEAMDWLNGRSVFNNRPLSEVISELERQFNLDIRMPDGFDRTKEISTGFPHTDADQALEITLGPLKDEGITYKRNGKIVVLE